MKQLAHLIICLTLLFFGTGPVTETHAYDEPWQEFAHPANPHDFLSRRSVVINDLFDTTGDVTITVPVLVVLLEFQDVSHRPEHTLQYWEDLVFGNPRDPITLRPSVAEVVRENSNGRFLLVPALLGDTHDGRPDGVIGWVRSQHRTDDPFWTQNGLDDEGPMRGRAEGIIAADPFFDYYLYDNNGDGTITNDELLIFVIFADNIPLPECGNGHVDPGEQCDDGNTSGNDGCTAQCQIHPLCGNGVRDTYEDCDDGNNINGDGCSLDCRLEGICGNNQIEAVEECDDGNLSNADGCSAGCFKEITCDQHVGHPNILPAGTTWCNPSAAGNARVAYDGDYYIDVDQNTQNPVNVYQLVAGDSEVASQGVLIHEAGHTLFGLADLYHACNPITTVDNGYYCNNNPVDWYPPKPDVFSTMDIPPVSNPPLSGFVTHLSPWAKIHLGFVKPLIVTHDGIYSLSDVETERDFSLQQSQREALIIHDPLRGRQEYFILENRNITGLPPAWTDSGLAVWLINEDKSEYRRMNRFIERGGYNVANDVSLWDGGEEPPDYYDLTSTSMPKKTRWMDSTESYIEITDISPAGSVMTFKVRMTPIFVDAAATGAETGSDDKPFDTLAEGIAAINNPPWSEPPRTIKIAGGSYPGAMVLNTPMTLMGWKNGNATIGQ